LSGCPEGKVLRITDRQKPAVLLGNENAPEVAAPRAAKEIYATHLPDPCSCMG
jgi:hypothetical protein